MSDGSKQVQLDFDRDQGEESRGAGWVRNEDDDEEPGHTSELQSFRSAGRA